ncbi:hypothetical protein BDR04DRAFT_1161481 [Suillus decipiens]|nr:hypothetical protein BDR04DRAFT_1161481 [Suillus decipiens]
MAPPPPKTLQATNQSVTAIVTPTTRGQKTTASKPLLSKSKEIENHLTDLDIRSEIKNSASAKKLLLSHSLDLPIACNTIRQIAHAMLEYSITVEVGATHIDILWSMAILLIEAEKNLDMANLIEKFAALIQGPIVQLEEKATRIEEATVTHKETLENAAKELCDQLADMAGITEVAHIKAAARYTHPDEAELWECLEEYNGNDYEEFANAVLYTYPGHGNKTFKHMAAYSADTPLMDSCEEDAIEYSDADTHHTVISPITDTEEQTTPTDIMITLLTFETLPMACQNEVPVPAAPPLDIALLPVQHSEPSLLPEDICNADNIVHDSYSEMLIPLESAITITYSATTNEEADTTKIEHECLLLRYSINVKTTLFIDTITEAVTKCPLLIKKKYQTPMTATLGLIVSFAVSWLTGLSLVTSISIWIRKQNAAPSVLATH